ncbi:putative ribnucleotide-diphosphate reductase subunit alpha [Brevibacillus phage SecTim467]|uniref:ribonucleoside-diphosphate reductase n=2 Tax=Jenstvirus jenst TaxID=1982225 RepID=A0A0K2CP92_9CAUD|nr:putative ribonucleotide-diphosphate reductase subunit alpha [Brevibacillus phage Jenst]ALA07210.1 putative ribonucleotide-diphosphate reductase subunit alpha [Brevibacillus phage Jenst]ALA07430.1 putative ribnucleotide-diphosphate reductase subunit alpha [Brevibacillus phage SecTim467]
MKILKQLRSEEEGLFPYVKDPTELYKERGPLSQFEGLQKLIMLDRYSFRDNLLTTLKEDDIVLVIVKHHSKYPTQGYGKVVKVDGAYVTVDVEYPEGIGTIVRDLVDIIKPLELYWEQIAYRVAKGVASVEKTDRLKAYWFEKFYWLLANMYNIPGGRILYGAGSGVDVTLFNCFVLPFIKDSRGGIIEHIGLATETMSRGGGVGSNISTLRPTKATVHGVNGFSSGSISWANYLSQLTHLIIQGGTRRGAQMIGLADWHPDVLEFILCKIQNPYLLDKISKETKHPIIRELAEKYLLRDEAGKPVGVKDVNFMTGANISVLISDDFMDRVEKGLDWELRFPDIDALTPEQKTFYDENWHLMGDVRKWEAEGLPVKIYTTIPAQDMWDFINTAARYSAEPGIIFIDHYTKEANCSYYAPTVVTNPCGEQGLPGFAVCNLNAVNLEKIYNEETQGIDWELYREILHVSQRFGDNIIDHSFYFLEENEKMAKGERRIGKGWMGLADLLIKLKIPYGSKESLVIIEELAEFMAVESYLASANIAEEKGSFPLFEVEGYLSSGFMRRLIASHPEVEVAIRKKGIRNVCSLTVAPTGSTGTMAGVAQGLEPFFAFVFYRSGRLGEFIEVRVPLAQEFFDVHPEATALPDYFVSAQDISPEAHIHVQAVIQKWVDSSLSKTANAPSTFTVEDNKKLYELAYALGCKGTTVYVDGSRDTQVLSVRAEHNTFEKVVEIEEDEQDLMSDTRSCSISFDDNGSLIKECH